MAITHATPSTVGTPAAGHIPTAGAWDADHTGTNDHGHTATADGGLIAPLTQARTATADGLTTGIIADKGFLQYVVVGPDVDDHDRAGRGRGQRDEVVGVAAGHEAIFLDADSDVAKVAAAA